MKTSALVALPALTVLAVLFSSAAYAGDAARGRQLFENTRGVTGKAVGNCANCHANQAALREMITNRGGKPSDVASVRRMLQSAIDGAVLGAVNAKAQYRGVLTPKDLDDLAAYLAGAKQSGGSSPSPLAQAAGRGRTREAGVPGS
ncbi:MAG TPA: c-type cytochrome [Burkholderiaceae bacterium]|nr:c-type cytochrome [Burkholderiaceae bacterium]